MVTPARIVVRPGRPAGTVGRGGSGKVVHRGACALARSGAPESEGHLSS